MSLLRRPIVLLGVVLVLVGLVATFVSLQDKAPSTADSAPPSSSSVPSSGAGSPQERVTRLQARVGEAPDDWEALAALGQAYVAQAAVTGDPSLYPRAEESIERSLLEQPNANLPASIAQGSLAAARHDFDLSLEWGEKALAIAPDDPNVQAVVGDALLELGRYDEAFTAFQGMINRRPDLAAYARISYARELQGDVDDAVVAMEAAESAASSSSDAAFAAFQLGELEWNRGRPDEAVAHYRRAAELDPDAPRGQAALARAAYYAGDEDDAVDQYRSVVGRLPLPQYVSELAAIYTVTDQPDLAEDQLDLLEAQRQLLEEAGVAVDADLAVINGDNDVDLEASLEAMETEWEVRKSIFVADALAWLLHLNGRSDEALAYSDEALRLDTRNALFYFHRSEIHQALGDDAAASADMATAKEINPNFSIRYSGRP